MKAVLRSNKRPQVEQALVFGQCTKFTDAGDSIGDGCFATVQIFNLKR